MHLLELAVDNFYHKKLFGHSTLRQMGEVTSHICLRLRITVYFLNYQVNLPWLLLSFQLQTIVSDFWSSSVTEKNNENHDNLT